MAFLIPDNLRGDKSVPAAHKRVVAALASGLDDVVTAWYEPPFDPTGGRPHFAVLDPTLGLLVLVVFEQNDPTDERLLGVWNRTIRLERGSVEHDAVNPLEQAIDYAGRLGSLLADDALLADIPVAAAAVFPYLTRAAADEHDLGSAVDLDRALFKDDIDAAIRDETVLPRRFAQLLEGGIPDELDDGRITAVRAILHPDVVIETLAGDSGQGSLFSGSDSDGDVVAVMDRSQERLAKGLGTGHRVIRGVAGSGKTLVLVHRARTLARLLPSKKILVTCFTKSLASQLRDQLGDYPNVEVVNLNKLMSTAIRRAGLEDPGFKGDFDSVPRVALKALEPRPGPRYRAVMVDEAQDFDTEALRFCVELLEATDAADQDLVIVADSAQNIFRKQFRWKDAGINAQGRTKILRVNYRNTREILRFAHSFLTADPSISVDSESDPEDELTIIPAESAMRSGPEPEVHLVGTVADEVDEVVATVKRWYSPALRPRSIAVLLAENSEQRASRIVEQLAGAGIGVFWVTDPQHNKNKEQAGSADDPVIVSSIDSAKGLEYKRVVVAGLGVRADDLARRKRLYVGFTGQLTDSGVMRR